ncbi:MAG: S9 family peptidase [Calditrichaeota bacterium]|nr:S9 family peptidase [Calditrichota bacterium]
MKPRHILMLLMIAWIALASAQKRAFQIADLYRIKNVHSPQISPDGKRIAFVVTEYFLEEGKSNADIYVMNLDGRQLKQMTRNPAADFHPRWSPDGRYLYYLSSRADGVQLWRLPVDGGEPEQITDFPMGIQNPLITPDGEAVVFSSTVFPECGADPDCNDAIQTAMDEGPIQAHMADRLLFRHWDFWKDGKRTHTLLFQLDSQTYRDLTPGDYDSPAFSLGGGAGFSISPDGKEICVVSNRDSNEWETTNKDLWIISLEDGQIRNITDDNEAYDGDPQYSPDGRYIAFRRQMVPNYESDRFRLVLYDRRTGETIVLTETFDNWVNDFRWAPDSRSLYFTADVRGHVPLYRVDIRTKRIQEILDVKTIDDFQITPDGKWIILVRRSVGEPREIWRATTKGKKLQRLTFFNKAIEDSVDIRPAEEMWIDSPTGHKIHTFIVKPHNFDPSKKYPLILNIHGGPQGMWADAFRGDWQVYPGAGYIVAFPNPHGSTGYGQAFTEAISRDWGGKIYQDILAVADSLAKLPYVDENRMGAMGWSYGGYMMMWLQGHKHPFKALAAMMGVYNLTSFYGTTEELWFPQWDLGGTPWTSDLYEKWSPHKFVRNFKTPCLVITGERDYRVSYTQSLEFFTALQKMGVPSRLIVFKNDGHWPNFVKSMPLYYNAHLDWFHKYLGGEPAPYDMQKLIRNMAFE